MLPPPGSVSAWGTEIPWADLKKKKIKICWAKRVELQCSHQKKKKDNYVRCKGYVNEGDFHIMYAYQITMLYTLNIILFIKYMSIKLGGLRNDFFLLRLWSSSFHPERSCFLLHLGTPSGPFTPPGLIGGPNPKRKLREKSCQSCGPSPSWCQRSHLFCLFFAEQLFIECPLSARCLGCVRKLEREKQNKTVIEWNTIRKFEWNEFCAMGKKKE